MANKKIKFILNNRLLETSLSPGMVTLDFIRLEQKLKGTKESCREGECGSCSVLLGELDGHKVNYKAVASCLLPLGELAGKHVVTIEGLNGPQLTPIQQALVDNGAIQCGYCTPGFVISLTGYFLCAREYDSPEGILALDGNICRCTGYVSIAAAVTALCEQFAPRLDPGKSRVGQLSDWLIVPEYFLHIPERLQAIQSSPPEISDMEGGALMVAGTTDLLVQKPDHLLLGNLEFLSSYKQLSGITHDQGDLSIGAGTTMEEFKESPVIGRFFPGHGEYMKLVASRIIRNRATLGGNVVNASPIADLTIFLLPLDVRLILEKGEMLREVPLDQFYKAYKEMDLATHEIVRSIRFPIPAPGSHFNFEKVSRRKHLDIASCNSAIYIEVQDRSISEVRISAGGVAPIPMLLKETAAYLQGKDIESNTIKGAAAILQQEISPISDVRGSVDYKRLLMRQLFYAHFLELFSDVVKSGELW